MSSSKKLSLMAQYDDMIRTATSLSGQYGDENHDVFIALITNFEKNQKMFCQTKKMLEAENKSLLEENQLLKNRLDYFKMAYHKLLKLQDQTQKERDENRKTIQKIQVALNDGGTLDNRSQVFNILSDFTYKHPAVPEDVNESDDGLLFDKSDDTLDNLDNTHMKQSTPIKQISPAKQSTPSKQSPIVKQASAFHIRMNSNAVLTRVTEESTQNDTLTAQQDKLSETLVDSPLKSASAEKCASKISLNPRRSIKLMNHLNTIRSRTKLVPERLDSRAHTFQQKKAFKSINCSVCSKSIGFCSTCMICVDCRGVVHQRCQDKLPKPCIPFVGNKAGLHKMVSGASSGHLVMINDFTTQNERPAVPALLIHCCNEIDRRVELAFQNSADTEAVSRLYQSFVDERQVNILRAQILQCKAGLPNLAATEDVNLLCCVVLSFLHDLDDPLLTRVLWNDFVRASEHVETLASNCQHSDYGSWSTTEPTILNSDEIDQDHLNWLNALEVLKAVIIQLPNTNRDSLCFLLKHFYRLLEAHSVTKLTKECLIKVFAFLIVGTSHPLRVYDSKRRPNLNRTINTPQNREAAKQEAVIRSLFRLSSVFWDELLNNPNFCPFIDLATEKDNQDRPPRKSLNQSLIKQVSQGNLLDSTTAPHADIQSPLY